MAENSWETYEKMVIDKLDGHTRTLSAIRDDIVEIKVELGIIKTKLAFIGAVSGAVTAGAMMLIRYVFDARV